MFTKIVNKLKTYKNDPFSLFLFLIVNLATIITVAILLFIIIYILVKGIPNITLSLFALEYNSDNVSLFPALINTILMIVLSLMVGIPIGVGSAIYLNEYAKKGSKFVKVISVMQETLSGIPSIVYGLFGSLFFVKYLHFGMSLLAGSLTLSIMILPLIISTSFEALKSVPDAYREGSFGLGAGKLRTIFKIVLPSANIGILQGIILAISKIVGESAALIFTSGTVAQVATNVFASSRTLAVHMYVLSSEGLHIEQTYATAVILLVVVIMINLFSKILVKKMGGNNANS